MSVATARPRLDVVIPVRTGAEYLPQAVGSVLAQHELRPRVLVVDDGAGIDLGALLDGLGAGAVTVLRNTGSAGAGGARNAGAAAGGADLLAFLDADDTWPDGRLGHLLDALDAPGPARAGMAFGTVALTDRDGRVVGTRAAPTAGATLLRRTTWDRVGPFATDLPAGEFIDWVSRARAAGIVEAWTPATVLMRRSHDGNMTRTSPAAAYVDVARAHLRRTLR